MLKIGIVRTNSGFGLRYCTCFSNKTGESRPCGDNQALNVITVPDQFPMPNIHNFTANLHEFTVFLNLAKAHHQIPMTEANICKAAINTPFGLFEFTRMPFRLRNAAQTFQIFIDMVQRGLPFMYAYIDDLR